ncbi:MAG TPA: class I SAM-dependent methyltransferase [Candidatus Sulfomarinibacteraceae bacterium]|nr:class I SAM-dependent methyltransferase [Candidatus Sulfomarinibacteraceae bacterium]
MPALNPGAFDAVARSYDEQFTHSRLGRTLRRRVWGVLGQQFQSGSHILEIACGTGEDAVWLAQQGVTVTACDGSRAMVRAAREKARAAGVTHAVRVHQKSLQSLAVGAPSSLHGPYDGLLSNFGGLNTIADWRPLGRSMAQAMRPGARAVLVPMGPYCPWEFAWFAGHGQFSKALRRQRQPAEARIGGDVIPIWYPSVRRLRADLRPWFRLLQVQSLGLWLPPSYLSQLVDRFPRAFSLLERLEQATAVRSGGWGDHYIAVFSRTSLPAPGS